MSCTSCEQSDYLDVTKIFINVAVRYHNLTPIKILPWRIPPFESEGSPLCCALLCTSVSPIDTARTHRLAQPNIHNMHGRVGSRSRIRRLRRGTRQVVSRRRINELDQIAFCFARDCRKYHFLCSHVATNQGCHTQSCGW